MNTNLHILKRSFGLIKGHKIKLFLGVLLSLISSFFGIGSGYTLKFLIDEVLLNKRVQWLWYIQFIFIALVLADCFFDVLKTAVFSNVAAAGLQKIRITLFKKILNLKYTVIKKMNIGTIINQMQYGVDSVAGILGGGIPLGISSILTIAMTLSFMFVIDWRLTLLSIPVYPVLIFINSRLNNKLSAQFSIDHKNKGCIATDVEQAVKCIDNIRTHNLHEVMYFQFNEHTNKLHKTQIHLKILLSIMNKTTWAFIMVPYQAILYGIGGSLFLKYGNPSIGTLLIFANFTNYLIAPVMALVNINHDIASAKAGFKRIDEIMNMEAEKNVEYIHCKNSNNLAEFNNFNFNYDEQNSPIIKNFTEKFEVNKTTILWGKSGSGKSTVLKILSGLLQASSDTSFSRSEIPAYFPQNPVLFNKTLKKNFELVNKNITENEIWDLLSSVDLKKRIEETNDRLDMEITNSENTFSGGEHRRLCLAVFLASNANTLLLDEPTASLDKNNAEAIFTILNTIKRNGKKTIIIATHNELLKRLGDKIIQFPI